MEITIIPINLYSTIYQNILLIVILVAVLGIYGRQLRFDNSPAIFNGLGIFILVFTLIYIGLRPIHGVFVDMTTYAWVFSQYEYGFEHTVKDPLFHYFTLFGSKILNINIYFFVCAALYIIPLYVASKKLFCRYWVYGFLFLVGSFSFWAYGTNTIRNGIAASLFILALSRENGIAKIFWIAASVGFHLSMLLPAACFAATYFNRNPKAYISMWSASILLSIVSGSYFSSLFAGIGLEDDRLSYLTTIAEEGLFSRTGFRWDFLIYSAIPIILGWYYIIRKNYANELYSQVFCTYTLTNAFWILVIQANYSDRFAYLSWCMMGILVCYPLLKKEIVANQGKLLSLTLAFYFTFTYAMYALA